MRSVGRVLLIPAVYIACGYSWLTYLVFGFPDDKAHMPKDFWGWLGSSMAPHWADWEARDKGVFHELKNLGSEWVRLDAQRAAKLGAFLFVSNGIVGLVVGFLLGWSL